jgi:hypothetical protein
MVLLRAALSVGGWLTLCGMLAAQTASGPAEASKIDPLKVFVVIGEDAGVEGDVAEKRKGKPTIFAFVQADKWDRPVARFLKALDQELRRGREEVALVVVWLTDDLEKAKEYLPLPQQSLKLSQTTWTIYPGNKSGPGDWLLNAHAHLTVVVSDGNKVAASLGFQSVNELDAPKVMERLPPKK